MTGAPNNDGAHDNLNGLGMQRRLLIITLILFGALSGGALWQHGYWGIFVSPFQSLYGGQVIADLEISLTLVMVWMWHDAKATGRNVWPWIVATLAFGSFGPLVCLLKRKSKVEVRQASIHLCTVLASHCEFSIDAYSFQSSYLRRSQARR